MKTFKGITSIFMVACMLVSLVAFDPTYAVAETSSVAPATPAEKIDAAIWDTTPDEQGRYLVYISRNAVSDDEIEAEFNKRNEFTLAEYTDETLYRRTVGPSVAVKAGYKYGLFESLSMELGRELYDDNISPFKYELIENYNNFIMNKREVMTGLYNESNKRFEEKYNLDSNDVLFAGQFTGSYVLYATRDQIEEFASDSAVQTVRVWVNSVETESVDLLIDVADAQVRADSANGTKSSAFNNGNGYKGSGIKIGIIEGSSGKFDPNAPMLQNAVNSNLFYVQNGNVEPTVTEHATIVTSIIVGHQATVDSVTYGAGIVPLATVYQTSNSKFNLTTLLDAIELLLLRGVTVINYSTRIDTDEEAYTTTTMELDRVISNCGVTFVQAAGNTGNSTKGITTTGIAYNVITVGNAYTKNSADAPVNSSYQVSSSSSFEEDEYLTNKPDIVAPGSNIGIPLSNGEYNLYSGTSIAAPIVTGIVAQIHSANETIMENAMRTKAVLLTGANRSAIATQSNLPAFSGNDLIRECSGLGMADAVDSVNIALAGNTAAKTLDLTSLTISGYHTLKTGITLTKGQTIRIVLTYSKPDSTVLTATYGNKASLYLYNGSTVKASSVLPYSNVEVLEYTATGTETLTIKMYVSNYNRQQMTSTQNNWFHAVAWRVY
ncbi:MAG: S8 family serine peptidase [Clostridia bacterium]|nr:S8 family serine peptidase [Clostridia bacterium]